MAETWLDSTDWYHTKSCSSIEVLQEEGKKFMKHVDKAEILNAFFHSVLAKETLPDQPIQCSPSEKPTHIH